MDGTKCAFTLAMTTRNTIRKLLDDEGFDWTTGIIILQETDYPDNPGLGETTGTVELSVDNAYLDQTFSQHRHRLACPRFVARDATAYYIPATLAGLVIICKIDQDIRTYLELDTDIPYIHC